MASAEMLSVTVVYLTPWRRWVLPVRVPAGTSLLAAVDASGIRQQAPELAGRPLDLGVFNRLRDGGDPVRDGDRIELYRPLAVDPKQARRARAELRRHPRGQITGPVTDR